MSELFKWQRETRKNNSKTFRLHDGPPYANGSLHCGHLLNKVIKDIINRYYVMKGYRVEFRPGWDCHGLPIELKVLENVARDTPALSALEIRKKARNYAQRHIEKQRKQLSQWGIMADWDALYHTMHPEYESKQLLVFKDLVERGLVHRAMKPVYWSPSSQTALAEAELEYKDDHTSTAVYVAIPYRNPRLEHYRDVRLLIWTTTPWSIIGNTAVCYAEALRYATVELENGMTVLIAEDLVENVLSDANVSGTIRETFSASELFTDTSYASLFHGTDCPVVASPFVTATMGTGLVHTAPAFGREDYLVSLSSEPRLDVVHCVDDLGNYREDYGIALKGKSIFGEGVSSVLATLDSRGLLLAKKPYVHRYPYDWRTKEPVIQRATAQWFIDISHMKETAIAALEDVKMIPATGRTRLETMVNSRSEWCISRQRVWGCPIPVFYHKTTGEPLLEPEIIQHIADIVKTKGTDVWWSPEATTKSLLPPKFAHLAGDYRKGQDTMDVWFDSGVSWNAVTYPDSPLEKASLVVEGSDQHRGWFQSSLLTSVAAGNTAPYETVLTHGYVLDGKMNKMSKSLGNVISPAELVKSGVSVDTLRLWTTWANFATDICISEEILTGISENVRKMRNTFRFLLGVLDDFDPKSVRKQRAVDAFMIHKLRFLVSDIENAYSSYDLTRVSHLIYMECVDISAFYINIVKERLYTFGKNCPERRSAQYVCWKVLQVLAKSLAPMCIHLCEEVFQFLPTQLRFTEDAAGENIFQCGWIDSIVLSGDQSVSSDEWKFILRVRDFVNFVFEKEKTQKNASRLTEFAVELQTDGGALNVSAEELAEVFSVSRVKMTYGSAEITAEKIFEWEGKSIGVNVTHIAPYSYKCSRCWVYSEKENLCERCESVVGGKIHTSESRL